MAIEKQKNGWGGKRVRAGRRRKLPRGVRFFGVHLPPAVAKALKRRAKEQGKPLSDVLREAVEAFLK